MQSESVAWKRAEKVDKRVHLKSLRGIFFYTEEVRLDHIYQLSWLLPSAFSLSSAILSPSKMMIQYLPRYSAPWLAFWIKQVIKWRLGTVIKSPLLLFPRTHSQEGREEAVMILFFSAQERERMVLGLAHTHTHTWVSLCPHRAYFKPYQTLTVLDHRGEEI